MQDDMKFKLLQNTLYHSITKYSNKRMHPYKVKHGHYWYKKYSDMTPEQKLLHNRWSRYYTMAKNFRNLIGSAWKGYNYTRELTLTTEKRYSLGELNNKLKYLKAKCKEHGITLFDTHVMIKHLQPGTGNYHVHITLLNVNSSISDTLYREFIAKYWKHGTFEFKRITNIYKWVQYCLNGIKPNNPQFINDKWCQKITYSEDTITKVEECTLFAEDIEYDNRDVLNIYKHKNSNTETIVLKPQAQVHYITNQDSNSS